MEYSIEGWVTAALWDIHDTVEERSTRTSHDRINGQTQDLWDTFSTDESPSGPNYIAKNMKEFKDDWNRLEFTSIAPLFSLNHLTGSITIPPTTTTSNTIFSDDFEGTLSQWTNTGDEQIWEILTISGDKVASSDDCSTYCYLVSDTINASQATTLTFDRYIDSGVDRNEGLKVLVSTDNGVSYTELVFYSQNYGQDDSTWHTETLDITQYQSSTFKVKFTGVSSYYNDIVRIDDVTITGSITPTVTPPTTSSSFEDNFNDLSNWTKSGTDRWSIVSTWGEGMPTDGDSNNMIVVANGCISACILTSSTIDLSSYSSATLELSRFVDRSLDDDEYLKVEVYNGSVWIELATWSEDSGHNSDDWESESFDISSYIDDNFKIKLTTQESRSSEDVGFDYIRIT